MNDEHFPWQPVTFAQCRELQDTYHEKVWEIAVALLENVAKGDQVEDMKDDVKIVGFHKKHNLPKRNAVEW